MLPRFVRKVIRFKKVIPPARQQRVIVMNMIKITCIQLMDWEMHMKTFVTTNVRHVVNNVDPIWANVDIIANHAKMCKK